MRPGAILARVAFAGALGGAGCMGSTAPPARGASQVAEEANVILVRKYSEGVSGIRAANPAVKLGVGHDPELPDKTRVAGRVPCAQRGPRRTRRVVFQESGLDGRAGDFSTGQASPRD